MFYYPSQNYKIYYNRYNVVGINIGILVYIKISLIIIWSIDGHPSILLPVFFIRLVRNKKKTNQANAQGAYLSMCRKI